MKKTTLENAMATHPINPPDDLVAQWKQQWLNGAARNIDLATYVAIRAYRAGADQELEACEKWLSARTGFMDAHDLRAGRRPKPPSLKEQALSEVAGAVAGGNITPERGATIRLALEQLND